MVLLLNNKFLNSQILAPLQNQGHNIECIVTSVQEFTLAIILIRIMLAQIHG